MSVTQLPDDTIGRWNLTSFGIRNMNIDADNIRPIVTSTHSSQGILKKFNLTVDDTLLYVKAGKDDGIVYSVLEPITECMVSRIGQLLKFPIVDYYNWVIDKDLFDRIEQMQVNVSATSNNSSDKYYNEDYEGSPIVPASRRQLGANASLEKTLSFENKALVSVSATFNPNNFQYVSGELYTQDVPHDQLYKRLSNLGGPVRLRAQEMILFDFLINNGDRHRKNFGFLKENKFYTSMAPLFDHGFSLLSNYSEQTLQDHGDRAVDSSTGKTFTQNLKQDMDLYVDFTTIREESKVDFSVDLQEVLDIVDDYEGILSKTRIGLIKTLLERRFNYVKRKILPS